MIKMKVTGVAEVKTRLRNIATLVPDTARKMMHASADRIVQEGRLNAPFEDGELEEAIHVEKSYEAGRGRLMIDVVAGGVVNGVDVDEYAAVMHESDYALGPNSLAKQAEHPERTVGRKYLERAAEDEQEPLMTKMIAAITRIVK
ncbi:hypothetical protein NKH72_22310 [Mesorhizobium sp. M0955]|uniref:HK97 gp10 family phage protein n=1 Tax=Mesorhizobium sp. M0955 TaxID=2957033 RepID=UPI003337220A